MLNRCCSQDIERGGEGANQEEEDPQDSGFITKMFEKVATTALGPSSLPTKVTPQHFQVQYPATFPNLSLDVPYSVSGCDVGYWLKLDLPAGGLLVEPIPS